MTVTGGLFDLQVNGFAGIDFNDATLSADNFQHALEAMAATGVVQCLPTLITATEAELGARFAALDMAVARAPFGAKMVPGYHLEGPFLNPSSGFRGCHPAEAMITPDIALVDRLQAGLQKPILLVTIAPELPGAEGFIRAARERGIVVALGHSDARLDDVKRAVAAGATLATHLGNGVAHQQHKFDNPIFAQLAEDRLIACFIADGIHVAPHALGVMLRAKTRARSILVTDAVAGAAAPPGLYPFAGMQVERGIDGAVREPGAPHLAGSALTLDQAVRNVAAWGFCSFQEAVLMASVHPRAALVDAAARHGAVLLAGEVRWSDDQRVVETTLAGEALYAAS
jgi:N-acetylglucosamine-6-phosphate deacetylase